MSSTCYQSFKTGQVTPEPCHRPGVELAQKMRGDRYQVLVTSRFNTGTYHNHFVVNAVGMWDGKKFNCNMGAYWKFRDLSDELCREHGLTVIQNPTGKTAGSICFAEKNGDPTRFDLMRGGSIPPSAPSTAERPSGCGDWAKAMIWKPSGTGCGACVPRRNSGEQMAQCCKKGPQKALSCPWIPDHCEEKQRGLRLISPLLVPAGRDPYINVYLPSCPHTPGVRRGSL